MAVLHQNFDEWFDQATGRCGRTPFPYQRALAESATLPELLEVPTGTGKTAAAILAWLWRRRTRSEDTPRRFVYCLPMRVLVEQTRTSAVRWLSNLGQLAGNATFSGDRLKHYRPDWTTGKVAVVTLMGGEAQRDWREHPEHEQIIIGTQDMLLSRALNRGFAMPPQMWPVDFGLLNVDALWVMDEVQLMGPGRTTSVQIQRFWEHAQSKACGSKKTLWMSATLGANANSTDLPDWMRSPERKEQPLALPPHRHSDADLQHSEFSARWLAPKRLEAHLDSRSNHDATSKPARGKRRRTQMAPESGSRGWTIDHPELLRRVLDAARGGRLVLVFVNQVRRARELYQRLNGFSKPGEPAIDLVHARMRSRDRRGVEALLHDGTPPAGRIVVATQVLEAGVDVDADAVFTELCPWPSLVQRLGRLNRTGNRPAAKDVKAGKEPPAPAIVFEPPIPDLQKRSAESEKDLAERRKREASLPYDAAALDESRKLIAKLDADHAGSVSPEVLAGLPVTLPLEGPVLRRFDLDDLFDTDPDLAGGHADVTSLLRADRDLDAYVLWRRIEGGLSPDEQVPIHREELCAVPFYEAQKAFAGRDVWVLTLATRRKARAAWRPARGSEIRAGDTVMVDITAGCYDEHGWRPDAKRSHPNAIIDRWEPAGAPPERAWVKLEADGSRSLIESIDGHVIGARARSDDWRCFGKSWMELEPHLRAAEQAASDLANALVLPDPLKTSVTRAARWHDVGKALERHVNGDARRPFQIMLIEAGAPENGHPRDGALYAKSNRSGGPPSGFRHELASALAFLEGSGVDDDLAAFLILAHHGKVRLLPSAMNDDDPVDLCGVRDGDRIPVVAMPNKPNQTIVLDTKLLLPSRERRSWQGRVGRLLAEHGPFVLAYLEGLVRVADWRASR